MLSTEISKCMNFANAAITHYTSCIRNLAPPLPPKKRKKKHLAVYIMFFHLFSDDSFTVRGLNFRERNQLSLELLVPERNCSKTNAFKERRLYCKCSKHTQCVCMFGCKSSKIVIKQIKIKITIQTPLVRKTCKLLLLDILSGKELITPR